MSNLKREAKTIIKTEYELFAINPNGEFMGSCPLCCKNDNSAKRAIKALNSMSSKVEDISYKAMKRTRTITIGEWEEVSSNA